MVEYALREGLSSGVGAEIGGEAERLVDGQISLDVEHGGADDLGLFEDVSTTSVEDTVDTSDGVLGTLDLDQVDGLHESGLGGKDAGVQATSGRGDDLTASSVDGVGVKGHVVDVESAGAHVLVAENAPLPP